jgi:hypothetical protein
MMGVFHTTSKDEQLSVKTYKWRNGGLNCYGTANILNDVSYEPQQHVWAEVTTKLLSGMSMNKKKKGKPMMSRRLQALQKAKLYKRRETSSDDNSEEKNDVSSVGSQYVRTGVPYFELLDED